MKNLFKLFGIIALIAIIGFSFVACGNGTTGGDGDGDGSAPDITFTLSDGTPGDNKFDVTVSGTTWREPVEYASYVGDYFDDVSSYDDLTYTLSADKKVCTVAVPLDSTDSITVKFSAEADSERPNQNGLVHSTVARSSSYWHDYNGYEGKITLTNPDAAVEITYTED